MSEVLREAAWHYLCSLQSMGIATILKLVELSGDVMEVINISQEELEEMKLLSPKMLNEWKETKTFRDNYFEYYEKLKDKSYKFISHEHSSYPEKLLEIDKKPLGLWYKGRLPEKGKKTAAIIGSRLCTEYGMGIAAGLGKKLSECGIDVISGMALGIDAAGQRAALLNGGYSLGVLGCGIDICYPRQNIDLYEKLSSTGGIVSEFPPGTPGFANNFRQRNRIISGLSDCVIVVEAKIKSGTQLTVSWALDQGRDVFAVPGRITDSYSKGCNQLISQGAEILYDFNTLKEYFDINPEINIKKTGEEITEQEKMVIRLMGNELIHFESLLIKTGFSTGQLMGILMSLLRKKQINEPVKNYFKKIFLAN